MEDAKLSLGEYVDELGAELGAVSLEPTKIYVKSILSTVRKFQVSGLVHVTGGGFYDNIPRILPTGLQAQIRDGSWKIPTNFSLYPECWKNL